MSIGNVAGLLKHVLDMGIGIGKPMNGKDIVIFSESVASSELWPDEGG